MSTPHASRDSPGSTPAERGRQGRQKRARSGPPSWWPDLSSLGGESNWCGLRRQRPAYYELRTTCGAVFTGASAGHDLFGASDVAQRPLCQRMRLAAVASDLHRHFPLGHAGHPGLTRCSTARFSTFTADGGHVSSVTAHHDSALLTRDPGLIRRPLVRRALLVGSTPTLTRNLALSRGIHRREPAPAFSGHTPPGRSGCENNGETPIPCWSRLWGRHIFGIPP